jgi:FtsZ-binding cell division protein ZapB
MIDTESIGKAVEGIGKIVGVGWLCGHHTRNAVKSWRARQVKKKLSSVLPPTDIQIRAKEEEAEEGRLIRSAVFNSIELSAQIEDLGRKNALLELEIGVVSRDRDQARQLAEQYRVSANEWQEEAGDWKKQAKATQSTLSARDTLWASLGTSYTEQLARMKNENKQRLQ